MLRGESRNDSKGHKEEVSPPAAAEGKPLVFKVSLSDPALPWAGSSQLERGQKIPRTNSRRSIPVLKKPNAIRQDSVGGACRAPMPPPT